MMPHLLTTALLGSLLVMSGAPERTPRAGKTTACAVAESPEYYRFPLVPTRNVPGTARSKGLAEVSYKPSPFGVSLAPDGSYDYRLEVTTDPLRSPNPGVFVAWAMTPELDQVVRLGRVDGEVISGSVAWNKFLVAITLEPTDDPEQERWSGPIVMRGLSRSGMMHTMAGHGPFEEEKCAAYGFGNE